MILFVLVLAASVTSQSPEGKRTRRGPGVDLRGQLLERRGDLIAAVPARDLVMFTAREPRQNVELLKHLVVNMYEKAGPKAVSRTVFPAESRWKRYVRLTRCSSLRLPMSIRLPAPSKLTVKWGGSLHTTLAKLQSATGQEKNGKVSQTS